MSFSTHKFAIMEFLEAGSHKVIKLKIFRWHDFHTEFYGKRLLMCVLEFEAYNHKKLASKTQKERNSKIKLFRHQDCVCIG